MLLLRRLIVGERRETRSIRCRVGEGNGLCNAAYRDFFKLFIVGMEERTLGFICAGG